MKHFDLNTAIAFILFLTFDMIKPGVSIGCFVCSSINGSEPKCEDTFNNTGNFYRSNCEAGRQGRQGLFPGTQCIKLKATKESNGEPMLIRQCVVDNGGVNSDTEIGRISHCGPIKWLIETEDNTVDVVKLKGCILSCDTDACNFSKSLHKPQLISLVFSIFTFYLL